jgi:hypothetical protein
MEYAVGQTVRTVYGIKEIVKVNKNTVLVPAPSLRTALKGRFCVSKVPSITFQKVGDCKNPCFPGLSAQNRPILQKRAAFLKSPYNSA